MHVLDVSMVDLLEEQWAHDNAKLIDRAATYIGVQFHVFGLS